MNPSVVSPMPTGSGAIVVHRMLERRLDNFRVVPYSPKLTYFPPALRWRVPRLDADIVHTTPDHGPFFKQPGVPLVVTFHNLVVDAFMRKYSTLAQRLHYATDLKFFLRRSLKIADRVTAVSEFTADLIQQEFGYEKPIDIIRNGVDTSRFHPASKPNDTSKPRVLFSGNPSLRKGAHWLPEIASALGDKATILCTATRGSAWANRLISSGVELVGKVPYSSMPEFYRSFDALLLPTVREGDSLAVLEALSSGLPVVASNCSSLPERIDHGEGGFLCEIGNVAEFVYAIEALSDPHLRASMGIHNRRRAVAEFDAARMIGNYAALFDAVATG